MPVGIEREAGTGDVVIETQHPHPAAVDDLMLGRRVAREGVHPRRTWAVLFFQDVVPAGHAGKMAVKGTRTGLQHGGINRLQMQRSSQKLSVAGGVDDETGPHLHLAVRSVAFDSPAVFVRMRADLQLIEINDAGEGGPLDKVGVEVGAEPVRVRGRRRDWRPQEARWRAPHAADSALPASWRKKLKPRFSPQRT